MIFYTSHQATRHSCWLLVGFFGGCSQTQLGVDAELDDDRTDHLLSNRAVQLNKAKRFRDEYDETKVGERDMKQNEKGETKELFLFFFSHELYCEGEKLENKLFALLCVLYRYFVCLYTLKNNE
jgi:hypothetical protein